MEGEFERLLLWVGAQALRVLAGAFLLALPVIVLGLVAWAHRLAHIRAYWRLPAVTVTASLAGALLGLSLLYADPYGPSFRIAAVFEVGGVWDVNWIDFLAHRADPSLYEYENILPVIEEPDTDPYLALVLLVAGVLAVAAVISVLVHLRGLDLAAGLVGVFFLVLLVQALTIYLSALAAYTLNTLNFWAALVAMVLLQYYRRDRHAKH